MQYSKVPILVGGNIQMAAYSCSLIMLVNCTNQAANVFLQSQLMEERV